MPADPTPTPRRRKPLDYCGFGDCPGHRNGKSCDSPAPGSYADRILAEIQANRRAAKEKGPVADPSYTPNPATAVAALAEASGDPAAFQLVYSALMRRYDDSCRVGHMTQFADEVAAHAVQVLRDAGRLQPAGGEPEWAWDCGERPLPHPHVGSELWVREVAPTIWTKGRAIRRRPAGPWLPAPCTCPDCDVSTLGDLPGTGRSRATTRSAPSTETQRSNDHD